MASECDSLHGALRPSKAFYLSLESFKLPCIACLFSNNQMCPLFSQ